MTQQKDACSNVTTKKKTKEKEYLWQVVQVKTSNGRNEEFNIGVPIPLERAKQIVEYKNATDIRSYVVYSLRQREEIK